MLTCYFQSLKVNYQDYTVYQYHLFAHQVQIQKILLPFCAFFVLHIQFQYYLEFQRLVVLPVKHDYTHVLHRHVFPMQQEHLPYYKVLESFLDLFSTQCQMYLMPLHVDPYHTMSFLYCIMQRNHLDSSLEKFLTVLLPHCSFQVLQDTMFC